MRPHHRAILFICMIGLAIILSLLGYRIWQTETGQAGQAGSNTPRPSIVAVFDLVDQNGHAVTQESYPDKYLLIYFGFAFCPDICPFTLDMMSAAMGQVPTSIADRIQPIFISLDPERDTPDELASYISNFDPRFVALTGTAEQVKAAAKQFKVYFRKVEDPQSMGGYVIDHSSIIYLIDPAGDFIQHFTHQETEQTIAKKLRQLIPE